MLDLLFLRALLILPENPNCLLVCWFCVSTASCFYNKQTSSNKLKISNESLILCNLTQFNMRARSISIESSRRGYSRYFLNFWSQKVIWPGKATWSRLITYNGWHRPTRDYAKIFFYNMIHCFSPERFFIVFNDCFEHLNWLPGISYMIGWLIPGIKIWFKW